ncbi:Mg chelatase-like protein [Actinoplanes sp. ATCC 53533]|uniref:YifB family Mg chelatase-like AAA ATPase n=1 Tax=Actinoplanes sp. ATCC 53533 TaxID=1288362 RepID=UPI000F772446|nr:YifB family Mg chelatase-like AAA ATPase [Actinoplanes sp. ATCC 53533]RSM47763.1 Mg chelatase-like protein [Actinoplanes sp. ATCC 53533]
MSHARVRCVGLAGVTGHLVEVEADLSAGRPALVLTGLPDSTVHETRDRVRAALINSDIGWPNRCITVNLLPATLPKHGAVFDVAIAAALLTAAGGLPTAPLDGTAVLGELGLDGSIRPVRGIVPMVAAAVDAGVSTVIVPEANAREAALVPGATVRAIDSLRRLADFIRGSGSLLVPPPAADPAHPQPRRDLAEVADQHWGRFGLEVAAAGGHHLALFGAPGTGRTILAEHLPEILPPLDDDEALEVAALQSIAGVLPPDGQLIRRPPWQAPHHSISLPALLGGGSGLARPGALPLAHRGVLFLDEATEIASTTLQALRQPLETGRVVLARARGTTEFPASAQLVIAANPCPCTGFAADRRCRCTPPTRRRYLARVPGQLLDRIDIRVTLDPQRAAGQIADPAATDWVDVAERVAQARQAAARRWSPLGYRRNVEVPGPHLNRPPWTLPPADTAQLRVALDRGLLSVRGYHAVLRLAWSIADLAGLDRPGRDQIGEAIRLRIGQDPEYAGQ